jgi:hypothetical protein
VGKTAVGLATKTSILKCIFKESVIQVIAGVSDGLISTGTEELSKVMVDEIINTNFMKYFDKFT